MQRGEGLHRSDSTGLEAAVAHLLADDDGMTVYIGCPELIGGESGKQVLAAFYRETLGWRLGEAYGTPFLSRSPAFRIGFDGDGWSDQRPPRWPDPEYPQQLHFDIAVQDLDVAGEVVAAAGGSLLKNNDQYRVYADPAGHPLCLYTEPSRAARGPAVLRLVYDCFSPRSLATFYQGFLGVQDRLEDSPERVVIDLDDDGLPNLAFQHSRSAEPRWPDPVYPAQLHVDYRFTVDHELPHFKTPAAKAAIARAEELGAIHQEHVVYADPAGHPYCL
jgi:catechol 2,3-dioxygenase-like lactoylglutathione lyase family enzyme